MTRRIDPVWVVLAVVAAVATFIEGLKSSGFVRDELALSGVDASASPPA